LIDCIDDQLISFLDDDDDDDDDDDLLLQVLSMAVLAFGIYLSTKHEECSRIMATPVLVSGGFILCL
jgi:hypothetical protein